MNIKDIQVLNKLENLEITEHARKRMKIRRIKTDDILNCINSGAIIEDYPNDYPFPSCLILGISTMLKELHVVVSIHDNVIYVITVYYPDPEKWNDDFSKRK